MRRSRTEIVTAEDPDARERERRARPGRIDVARLRNAAAGRDAVQVDQLTRRSDAGVLEGLMAVLDLENPEVLEAVTAAHGGTLAPGQGKFGVYVKPVELEPDGYPRLALVMLRDNASAYVTVPYSALAPVPAGMKVR